MAIFNSYVSLPRGYPYLSAILIGLAIVDIYNPSNLLAIRNDGNPQNGEPIRAKPIPMTNMFEPERTLGFFALPHCILLFLDLLSPPSSLKNKHLILKWIVYHGVVVTLRFSNMSTEHQLCVTGVDMFTSTNHSWCIFLAMFDYHHPGGKVVKPLGKPSPERKYVCRHPRSRPHSLWDSCCRWSRRDAHQVATSAGRGRGLEAVSDAKSRESPQMAGIWMASKGVS